MTQKTDDVLNAWEHLLAEIQAHGVHHNIHAGTLDTLNKFIRTQPPQDGWKSMESAPRDGTEFLAHEDGGLKPLIGTMYEFPNPLTGWQFVERGFWFPTYKNIKYWQPLPEAPQPAKTDGDKL